jgi:hypothetical protein
VFDKLILRSFKKVGPDIKKTLLRFNTGYIVTTNLVLSFDTPCPSIDGEVKAQYKVSGENLPCIDPQ